MRSYGTLRTSHQFTDIRGSRGKVLQDADTDLQRAIQLSLEDAGAPGALTRSGYTPSQPSSAIDPASNSADLDLDNDADLRAAIEASLRDASNLAPSAPSTVDFPQLVVLPPHQINTPQGSRLANSSPSLPNYDMDLRESDTIMTFTQTVEQAQYDPNGRDISRYPLLNQLYDQANGLRPKLAMSLDDTSRRESGSFPAYCVIICY